MMVRLFGRTKGSIRHNLLKEHRLAEFEKSFDNYIAGKIPAEAVSHRRKKMNNAKRGKL